jgi:hypothetical protein
MRSVVVALLLMVAPLTAVAEINMADSIEWVAADSDLVVRGKVTAVAKRKGPGDVVWYDVTVGVAETLKGAPRRSVTFAVRHLYGATPAEWKAKRRELLLFLVDSKRRLGDDKDYARAPFALRPHDGAALALDGAAPDRAYSSSFAVLDRRADILAAARAGATSTAPRSHRLDVPYDAPAFQALWGGSAVWMTVPVDARLEQLALRWVTAKDLSTREEGVAALAHFRTPASIAVVERLLGDPDFAVVQESGKKPVKRFLVRKRAHEVLDAWGVRHATPIIDAPHTP